MLRLDAFEVLALLFNAVESSGVWPQDLLYSAITLIPKGYGLADPTATRPISVASAVYRLWAACRAQELSPVG